jgi:hypothetical protein
MEAIRTFETSFDFQGLHGVVSQNSVNIVTDLINALPDNSSVNTVSHAKIDETVFSLSSAPSSSGTTELCNRF